MIDFDHLGVYPLLSAVNRFPMICLHKIGINHSTVRVTLAAVGLVAMLLFFSATRTYAAPTPPNLPKAEIIRLGEQMYRDGILPSGKPMPAFIRGDVEVDSTAFSCSSCHLRAGLGSFEGGVVTPPTTGSKLYKPYHRPPSLNDAIDRSGRFIYAKTVQERPAYTRKELATALRFGIDPAGQEFNDIMPRYPLASADMNILISYLESLSSTTSPGATPVEFAFATIITDDVSADDRQALLGPLQKFISEKNDQQKLYREFLRSGFTATLDMKDSFRRTSLDIWELKGSPESWRAQLAAYYAKKPVFAVLGGISNSEWQPIHNFCEAERLPCIYPITNLPAISESGWYTYYYNRGYSQEGEAAAAWLNRRESLTPATPILQLVQDSPAGRALATGFDSNWQAVGRPAVTSITVTAGQLHDVAAMKKLI